MFKKTTLDFKTSGALNKLVADYIHKKENLKPFYGFFPDEAGFAQLLKTPPYADFDRGPLSKILDEQARQVKNTSEASFINIQKLSQKNTFTVTTGHQLCLFTGPLYFIYKILSAINLAERLKTRFPDLDFVPVYWMASEDHDFEEINHFHSSGKTIRWKSSQTGGVGNFKTDELKKLLPQIQELFGRSENADYLSALFEDAYLKHGSLSDATRFLANALFGNYGLVTLDGNERSFKQQFVDEFRKDIFENSAQKLVTSSITQLEAIGYTSQVNPRPINCFFLEEGLRTRIEKNGDVYNLVGTRRSFTKPELEAIIETSPEKISPNVVLRPLYQQVILPNLAYVGGPGELAYWLEFKNLFDKSGVLFPILLPRNFVTFADKHSLNKINQLGFLLADLFKPEQELIKELQVKKDTVFNLDREKSQISEFYAAIMDQVIKTDKTLSGSVAAELKRTLNGFDRINAKTNRSIRRKLETEINQLSAAKERLFPNNVPQERYENFSSLYIRYGKQFMHEIKTNTDPFLFEQVIFSED